MPQVIDHSGAISREEPVPSVYAGKQVGSHTIFRAVFREFANPRAGTASTKRRDEVSGGGRKPWKQKGTGRARQGSTRSPQWRHGGVVFGPKPRSYVSSLNRKERRAALIAALADRYANGGISLLDTAQLAVAKTKDFAKLIFGDRRAGDDSASVLVVYAPTEVIGEHLERCGRNLRSARIASTDALDISAVLRCTRLILTLDAQAVLTAKAGD